jgi:putative thiamine transport system permease protein
VGTALRAGLSANARAFALAPPLLLFALPIASALPVALWQGLDAAAWRALAADPQVPRAWALSVASALASTAVALLLALGLVTHLHGTPLWERVARALGPMLALPHAAFAIGLALLVMPAGLVARLLAPVLGWDAPPDWPFLLWNLVALLARPELALQLRGWVSCARTLGYRDSALWWRVLWPLLLPRLAWPLLAVLAYSLTVVDLALIVGPASPPTLAVLAWQGLQDGDAARNAEGAASALLLALTLAALVAVGWTAARGVGRTWRRAGVSGQRRALPWRASVLASALWRGVLGLYAVVAGLLALSSFTGVWRFPSIVPQTWSLGAWAQVRDSAHTVVLSAGLGLAATIAALLLVLLWFESTPRRWDARAMPLVLAPLVVPPLLLLTGLYTLALPLRLDGTRTGLAWVHTLAALPYVFVALAPAWRSFDVRYEHAALALGRSRLAFWWRIKAPLLAAPMAAALAVGFAVSVGRYTEAVTLASGGQRHTAAAFAALQALLPALGFALAAWVGRRQRSVVSHGA